MWKHRNLWNCAPFHKRYVVFKKLHKRSLYFWLACSPWGDPEAEFQSLDVASCAGCESSRSQFSFAFGWEHIYSSWTLNIEHTLYTLFWQPSKLLSVVRYRKRVNKGWMSLKSFGNPACASWIGRDGKDVRQQVSVNKSDLRTWPRTIGSGPPLGVSHCNQPLESFRKSEHLTDPGRSPSVSLWSARMAVSGSEELSKW